MSSFEISSELKSAFLVNRSQIEGRLDPNYNYLNSIVQKRLASSRYPVEKLIQGIKYIQYGTSSLASKESIGYPIIRMNNIQDEVLELSDIKYITLDDTEIDRYALQKGDLLFNRTNSKELVGKCAVFSEEGIWVYASYIIRVRLEESYLSSEYASAFLSSPLGRLQINCISRQIAGMTNINAEEIKQLKIPVPPISIQYQVVEHIDKARKQKSQKEARAAEQIARIDEYLLAELEISLPEADNALVNRMFTVNFSESSGKRFDPLFYYRNFLDQVLAGRYPVEPLSRHVAYFQAGFAAGKGDQSTGEVGVIQLRPTNLNDDRELVFDRNVYIHRDAVEKRPGDLIQPGEVLFNNTNSQELVGKSVLFDLEDDYFCSNHMTRIRTASTLHPDYLAHLLNLYQRQKVFFRVCTNWNNQSGVNNTVLSGLPIPVPPIDQQKTMADTITALRSSAKQLRQEAKDELEKARQEVERMILEE